MKYLVILAIAAFVFWLWRTRSKTDARPGETATPAAKARPAPPGPAVEIVACQLCHVHFPRSEALLGPGGAYCSAAHKQQAEA